MADDTTQRHPDVRRVVADVRVPLWYRVAVDVYALLPITRDHAVRPLMAVNMPEGYIPPRTVAIPLSAAERADSVSDLAVRTLFRDDGAYQALRYLSLFGASLTGDGDPHPPAGDSVNHVSARRNADAVQRHLDAEVAAGRVEGPFSTLPPGSTVSPMACIPRSDPTRDPRILVDLTHSMVNQCSPFWRVPRTRLHTVRIQADVLHRLRETKKPGHRIFASATDIKSAYRAVRVSATQRSRAWLRAPRRRAWYVDRCLAMGHRLSAFWFQMITAASGRFLLRAGHIATAYLDDQYFPSHTEATAWAACILAQATMAFLNLPIAVRKLVTPQPDGIESLGVVLNGTDGTRGFTAEKWEKFAEYLRSWKRRKYARRHDLSALVGKLTWYTQVCYESRPSLHAARRLLRSATAADRPIRIPRSLRKAMAYWLRVCARRPTAPLVPLPVRHLVYSDASHHGMGWWAPSLGLYCSTPWPIGWEDSLPHVTTLEGIAAVHAIRTLQPLVPHGETCMLFTDNVAANSAVSSLCPPSDSMVRVAEEAAACMLLGHGARWVSAHIPGRFNGTADFCSRTFTHELPHLRGFRVVNPDEQDWTRYRTLSTRS